MEIKNQYQIDEFLNTRREWINTFNKPRFSWHVPENSPKYLVDNSDWKPYSKKLEILSKWIKIDHCWLKTIKQMRVMDQMKIV